MSKAYKCSGDARGELPLRWRETHKPALNVLPAIPYDVDMQHPSDNTLVCSDQIEKMIPRPGVGLSTVCYPYQDQINVPVQTQSRWALVTKGAE